MARAAHHAPVEDRGGFGYRALRVELGTASAASVVVGGIIGASIFITPGLVAAQVSQPASLILVWAIAAVMAVSGAICFAELGAALPLTGGTYQFIRRAYYPLPISFMFGWTWFFGYASAAIAVAASGMGLFASALLDSYGVAVGARPIALVAITVFTAINYLGIVFSSSVQNALTVLKVAALLLVTAIAFRAPGGGASALASVAAEFDSATVFEGVPAGLMLALFAFSGWHFATHIAGEIREPARVLPRATLVGLGLVVVCYALIIGAFMHALSFAEMRSTETVAADAVRVAAGGAAWALVPALAIVAAIGGLNAQLLNYPRIVFAVGDEFPRIGFLARVDPRTGAPALAILLQGAMAFIYAALGTYSEIVASVALVSCLFLTLGVLAVPVLRHREPELDRPFKAWGYPLTPAIFVTLAVAYMAGLLATRLELSLIGIGITLVSIPVWFLLRGKAEIRRAA